MGSSYTTDASKAKCCMEGGTCQDARCPVGYNTNNLKSTACKDSITKWCSGQLASESGGYQNGKCWKYLRENNVQELQAHCTPDRIKSDRSRKERCYAWLQDRGSWGKNDVHVNKYCEANLEAENKSGICACHWGDKIMLDETEGKFGNADQPAGASAVCYYTPCINVGYKTAGTAIFMPDGSGTTAPRCPDICSIAVVAKDGGKILTGGDFKVDQKCGKPQASTEAAGTTAGAGETKDGAATADAAAGVLSDDPLDLTRGKGWDEVSGAAKGMVYGAVFLLILAIIVVVYMQSAATPDPMAQMAQTMMMMQMMQGGATAAPAAPVAPATPEPSPPATAETAEEAPPVDPSAVETPSSSQ